MLLLFVVVVVVVVVVMVVVMVVVAVVVADIVVVVVVVVLSLWSLLWLRLLWSLLLLVASTRPTSGGGDGGSAERASDTLVWGSCTYQKEALISRVVGLMSTLQFIFDSSRAPPPPLRYPNEPFSCYLQYVYHSLVLIICAVNRSVRRSVGRRIDR